MRGSSCRLVALVVLALGSGVVAAGTAGAKGSPPCYGVTTGDLGSALPKPTKLRLVTSDETICDIEPVATDPRTHLAPFNVHVVILPGGARDLYESAQQPVQGIPVNVTPITKLPKGWEGFTSQGTVPGDTNVGAYARRPGGTGLAGRTIEVDVAAVPTNGTLALSETQRIAIATHMIKRAIARVSRR